MSIFDFVQTARKSLGLTQTELVKKFNSQKPRRVKISRGMLSKYETGENAPSVITFQKMEKVLKRATADKIKSLS
jgi:transcriptional regulator with XRE-family HTH domain